MAPKVYGMRAGYILPILSHNELYHTRKHGISQFKGVTMDGGRCMFIDKNKMIQMVPNSFEGLVQFLAVNQIMQLGTQTDNVERGIGL